MPTWLDSILHAHKDYESPLNYWRWAGLTALSAILKDSVYLDRHMYKIYPNIYTILYGESGIKKGPPIALANKLVEMVGNTNIIKGRSSIQAILADMGMASSQPGGNVKINSCAFISASEMSSALVEDPAAIKILTDLYDRNYNEGEWKSLLKSGTFKLSSPTVTTLMGTNESMADDLLTSTAVKGGFLARTFIIHETKRNKRNSLVLQPDFSFDYVESVKYLKELAKLKGPFKSFSSLKADGYYNLPITYNDRTQYVSEVGMTYHKWYDDFLDTVDTQEVKDETGTLNRFGDSVVKVAMLLSLAEQPKLEISMSAMHEAIRICEQLLGNVRKTVNGSNGTTANSHLKKLIIMELFERETHTISREMLTKKFYMHHSGIEELDHVMESFDVAGMIKTQFIGESRLYKMPDSEVSRLKKFFDGKQGKL